MTARALVNVVHTMLLDAHGAEKVSEMLAPAAPSRADRMARLHALGVEVG